jgi:hypothetical protein
VHSTSSLFYGYVFETPININWTTGHHIPEDDDLDSHGYGFSHLTRNVVSELWASGGIVKGLSEGTPGVSGLDSGPTFCYEVIRKVMISTSISVYRRKLKPCSGNHVSLLDPEDTARPMQAGTHRSFFGKAVECL